MSDDNYKREEDRRWREDVNKQLSTLMASEVTQNSRLDALHANIEELSVLLEGAPDDRNDNGLKGDIRELSVAVNRLNAALSLDITGSPGYDLTGKPGPLKKIEILWNGSEKLEKKSDRRLSITLSVIALAGVLLTNLDKIAPIFKRSPPPVESKTKQKKQRKRIVVVPREIQDGTDEEMPE